MSSGFLCPILVSGAYFDHAFFIHACDGLSVLKYVGDMADHFHGKYLTRAGDRGAGRVGNNRVVKHSAYGFIQRDADPVDRDVRVFERYVVERTRSSVYMYTDPITGRYVA